MQVKNNNITPTGTIDRNKCIKMAIFDDTTNDMIHNQNLFNQMFAGGQTNSSNSSNIGNEYQYNFQSTPASTTTTPLSSIQKNLNTNNTTPDNSLISIGSLPPPEYRMPPQPPGGGNIAAYYGEAQIPGAAPIETGSSSAAVAAATAAAAASIAASTVTSSISNHHLSTNTNSSSGIPLRTHSSKFPIERELILNSNNDKSSTTKIPLMNDRNSGLHLLQRQTGTVAPDHPPKQLQAWNTQSHQTQSQSQQQHHDSIQATLTGAIPRTPARLPEDVTALAERENNKDRTDQKESKNAVTKTYHTIKDLISSRFKKDSNDGNDELNNVVTQQQNQANLQESDELRSPYSALPIHMRQMQAFNQSQPNIWNGGGGGGIKLGPGNVGTTSGGTTGINGTNNSMNTQSYLHDYSSDPLQSRVVQQRAASQPQLNMPFDRRGSQILLDTVERRGSLANIDVTDSDDGGFASRNRRPQTVYQTNFQQQQQQQQQQLHQQQQQQQQQHQQQLIQGNQHINQNSPHRNSPYVFQTNQNHNDMSLLMTSTPYATSNYQQQQQQQQQQQLQQQSYTSPYMHAPSPQAIQNHHMHVQQQLTNQSLQVQVRHDILRASFQQKQQELQRQQQQIQQISASEINSNMNAGEQEANSQQSLSAPPKAQPRTETKPKQMPSSTASSDYDKSGNHSSNVDSGRGSAAYSSGRKAPADTSPESSDSPPVRTKENDTDWVDIVDAELRNILEPGMQALNIRPESTVSGSVSSITPPLPPLSPDGSSRAKPVQTKDTSKIEYGMDSYNRSGRNTGPIGPSRAGWPGSSLQKHVIPRSVGKKQEQSLLKRHLFGLDNDQTSTTTRSLDLDSLLGGPWGAGQSVSDSETDTQGLRHIRSQLEGLEHMYSEVLRMLGSRIPGNNGNQHNVNNNSRINETSTFRSTRRRHGSLSSLPSSSVSSRPIRDHRRRNDDRRKVRDMKGINKRFQRLESHVVTLARSVAHLSSEMRSQHLVTQELERLRDDLTALRSQAVRSQNIFGNSGLDPEPPNLTNPRRVKKLQKFFGEDPPLIRLFLKKLGYEKYASLFEAERVGMVELPYLGEERLQKLGVPLGPRLRILQEAQISLCKDTTLCIV